MSKARATTRRNDGRRAGQLRPVSIATDFIPSADGSCLIAAGDTRVICTACIAADVPPWMEGKGRGWVTAEYGMLPASTSSRKRRPIGKPDSRGTEIQRLIGRVLRSAVNLEKLGEITVQIDCDVIQADGGTRTASITGAYVALGRALEAARAAGTVSGRILNYGVAAVSVGVVDGRCLLDLDYSEDSRAETDMNIALTSTGRYVEVQGSAEGAAFTGEQLGEMLSLASQGCRRLIRLQKLAIAAQSGSEVRLDR